MRVVWDINKKPVPGHGNRRIGVSKLLLPAPKATGKGGGLGPSPVPVASGVARAVWTPTIGDFRMRGEVFLVDVPDYQGLSYKYTYIYTHMFVVICMYRHMDT